MSAVKKKRARGPGPECAKDRTPRDVVGGTRRALSYPTAREWMATVAIAAGLVATGCAEPECDSSPLGELRAHTDVALDQLGRLELRAGLESLGVGVGITPHPPAVVPGMMMPVVPILPIPEDVGETGGKN